MARRLTRRSLIRYGALGGVAAAGGRPSFSSRRGRRGVPALGRRARVRARGADDRRPAEAHGVGAETARSLAEKYLARIEALDRRGPALRAVLEINPDALGDRRAPRRGAQGRQGCAGPLHGIPVLIKDNIDTADRMTTTAGSLALSASLPAADAFVVERLREAGAVILGKTNLSRVGQLPLDPLLERLERPRRPVPEPLRARPQSLGLQLGLRRGDRGQPLRGRRSAPKPTARSSRPSNNCGLVGIKPTVGPGLAAPASSRSPTARTPPARWRARVTDAAILLGALAGHRPADAGDQGAPGKAPRDYTKFLDPKGLEGARIGVPRKGSSARARRPTRLVEAAIDDLKRAGRRHRRSGRHRHGRRDRRQRVRGPALRVQGRSQRLPRGLGPQSALPDARRTSSPSTSAEPRPRDAVLRPGDLREGARRRARSPTRRTSTRSRRTAHCRATEGIDATMDEHRLDALVAPTSGPATLIDLVNGDYGPGGAPRLPAVAGYPHITRARAASLRPAGGTLVLRPRLERADADPARLRLRAGDEAPPAAAVPADGRPRARA